MASADLRKELECSICLNIYTDPVTLKCGHNFCQDCIGHVLDSQERSGGYSCPECREEFQDRPALQRNITLRNIVKNFQSVQPGQEYSGGFTSYSHTPIPAVKPCLHCQASPCNNCQIVHRKSPEHVLCEPNTSLENRICSVHNKQLRYYCTEDSTYMCITCLLAEEHRAHQVETFVEAALVKKNKLRNVLQKLMTEKEETEKSVQGLQEHRRKVQGKADDVMERVTALFRDLRRHLEDLEKMVLNEISGQAEQVSLSLSDMIQQLEIKKEKLSRKMGDIEELCNMTDPLTVLQKSDTGDFCDTEDGNEDRERHDKLLHEGGDLDVAGISHKLHMGISDIISGVNVQKCTGTHVCPQTTTQGKGHINAGPSRRQPQPTPTIQHSHCQAGRPNIGAVQPTSGVSGVADILLDVSTASNRVHILDDGKTAFWSSLYQSRPETAGRFRYDQVISSQSFSSGRHYWEVDVGGSLSWMVAMCYPSIDRRGIRSLFGFNNKSWSFGKQGNYVLLHNTQPTILNSNVFINRVRMDLDYEAGRISFYNLCDPIRHLHTFTTTFTEPLHVGLRVWPVSGLKISGGNQMRDLPRE